MRTTHLTRLAAVLSVASLAACSGTGGGLVDTTAPIVTTPSTQVSKPFDFIADAHYDVTIDSKTYSQRAGGTNSMDFADLPLGFSELAYSVASNSGSQSTFSATGAVRLYNQPYSTISALSVDTVTGTGGPHVAGSWDRFSYRVGADTNYASLPTGTYTYTGTAFTATEQGSVSLDVVFGADNNNARTIGVDGTITGLASFGTITIYNTNYNYQSNNDTVFPTNGSVTATESGITFGQHSMRFYGPNAEEVLGILHNNISDIYYGGARP